jgi:hypothetical protein
MNSTQITGTAIGVCIGVPWLLCIIYILKRWLCPPPVHTQYVITPLAQPAPDPQVVAIPVQRQVRPSLFTPFRQPSRTRTVRVVVSH